MAARTSAFAAELLARSRNDRYDGIAIASRMPRMMMTTSSSMRVKPLSSPAIRFRNFSRIYSLLLPVRDEARRSRRPQLASNSKGLRAGSGDDVRAGAGLVPGRISDRALDAVRRVRRRLDEQLARDDCRVVRLQSRDGHARITSRRTAAGVVGVVGLDSRDGRTDVCLCGRVVGAIAERQVRRNRDRQQDAEDDDDNEQLDEGEAALLTGHSLQELLAHLLSTPSGSRRGETQPQAAARLELKGLTGRLR